ncbi:hypothetical protein [Nocardia sp. CA-135398]|uniref:hypothetical protein n=1 Tax=Nocardia sp. CA-135398 TaxID=3239977 RepID=UPI003D952535
MANHVLTGGDSCCARILLARHGNGLQQLPPQLGPHLGEANLSVNVIMAEMLESTLWTYSAWTDKSTIYTYASAEPQRSTVARKRKVMREATFVFFSAPTDELPMSRDEIAAGLPRSARRHDRDLRHTDPERTCMQSSQSPSVHQLQDRTPPPCNRTHKCDRPPTPLSAPIPSLPATIWKPPVLCNRDRTIPSALQRLFITHADEAFPDNPTRVIELESSHSPFPSMPVRAAEIIATIP